MTDEQNLLFSTLGTKTFWIMFLRRAIPTLVLLALLFILQPISRMASEPLNSVSQGIATRIADLTDIVARIAAYISVLLLALYIIIAWLEYTHYVFAYSDHAFIIHRGIFNIEEYSIPYNKIQNVEIERPLIYRILGVSKLMISTAGREDANDKDESTEGYLQPVDTTLARLIREELLHHSDVQEVTVVKA